MDPIADMITRIRNASAIQKESIVLPYSKMKLAIAELLISEGYIVSVTKKGKKVRKSLEVFLAYDPSGKSKIQGMERVSKFSRRVYTGVRSIHPVKQGHGTYVFSTPKGILSSKGAKAERVGGEVLFKIW